MNELDACLDLTAELWNKWLEIPGSEKHPSDDSDFRFHIHALQNILLAQIGAKHYPKAFKSQSK